MAIRKTKNRLNREEKWIKRTLKNLIDRFSENIDELLEDILKNKSPLKSFYDNYWMIEDSIIEYDELWMAYTNNEKHNHKRYIYPQKDSFRNHAQFLVCMFFLHEILKIKEHKIYAIFPKRECNENVLITLNNILCDLLAVKEEIKITNIKKQKRNYFSIILKKALSDVSFLINLLKFHKN